VKSCGSDVAVLASSRRKAKVFRRRRRQKSRSPGRARDKPSSHCAGKAGMRRLYLYARVHLLQIAQTARGTAGAGSTRSSLRPLISMGANEMQTSGETCRENAKLYPRHCEPTGRNDADRMEAMASRSAITGSDHGHFPRSGVAICPFGIQIIGSHLAYFYRPTGIEITMTYFRRTENIQLRWIRGRRTKTMSVAGKK